MPAMSRPNITVTSDKITTKCFFDQTRHQVQQLTWKASSLNAVLMSGISHKQTLEQAKAAWMHILLRVGCAQCVLL